jgi:hypothetical protein
MAPASAGTTARRSSGSRSGRPTFAYAANSPAGPLGDYLGFHANLSRQGERAGTDGGTWFFTTAAGEAQCNVTLSFGRGDIAAQGLNTDPTPGRPRGDRRNRGFKGVSGELVVEQVTEERANMTHRVNRPVALDD